MCPEALTFSPLLCAALVDIKLLFPPAQHADFTWASTVATPGKAVRLASFSARNLERDWTTPSSPKLRRPHASRATHRAPRSSKLVRFRIAFNEVDALMHLTLPYTMNPTSKPHTRTPDP